jgi:membrane protein required for colicin V production
MGFNSGLLRSLATIIGYVIAAPVALGVAPAATLFLTQHYAMPEAYSGTVTACILLITGVLFSALLRRMLNDVVGTEIGFVDRVTGALLGIARIALLAVMIAVIFDRILPPGRQPQWLKESQLYPKLSAWGQIGVKALPPEAIAYIDRLKKERGL